ncbi:MAG: hypothetical protein FGF52_06200 [Candidatus Brockarchaeota archaeon]|nr:hypothetical protein [Candidatus Brockarchaeota archaeon]
MSEGKNYVLITPGHELVLDTLIMYGVTDELFRTYAWVDGNITLQGERFAIHITNIRPSDVPLPEEIKEMKDSHIFCGKRTGSGKTARLEISPTRGKFERVGPKWQQKQYKICDLCESIAKKGEAYIGKREVIVKSREKKNTLDEYWVLSPVEIQIPLILSIKGLKIFECLRTLKKVNFPHMLSFLTFLSVLPSPLPGNSWLFSIYRKKRRLESAYIGSRADNIHRFVWTVRREYPQFSRLIKALVELAEEGNLDPLIKLTDVAMTPSLSLAYIAIRKLRSALEDTYPSELREFNRLGKALMKWCQV